MSNSLMHVSGILTGLPQDPLNQLPPPASTFAADVDGLYYFITYVSIFFFVLITGILVVACIKFRRRTPDQPAASNITHHTALEVTWTVIPLILVMIMFAWGWKGSLAMTMAQVDSLQYEVVGKQWVWLVKHPGQQTFSDEPTMYVPVDTPIRVQLSSQDVLHSFFVPAFRVKRDTLPGRYQMVWFTATKIGTYDMFCTEYCGTSHSYMLGKVQVVSKEDWAAGLYPPAPKDPKERGRALYTTNCAACHGPEGNGLLGPSLRGLVGKKDHELADGTKIEANVDYIVESIRNPGAKLAKPLIPGTVMNAFPESLLDKAQVDAIVLFMTEELK